MHDSVSPGRVDRVLRISARGERGGNVERDQVGVVVDLVLDRAPGSIELGLVHKVRAGEETRSDLAVPQSDNLLWKSS